MIPDIKKIKGKLIEMHGSPKADVTHKMVSYIREMQKAHCVLTCYYDIRGELAKTIEEDDEILEKIWISPSLAGNFALERLRCAANYTDIIVIDDVTYLDGDLWQFLASLRRIAEKYDTAIFLLNQRRFVKNHGTQEFEDLPYRCNIMKQYCSYAIDADTEEVLFLDFKEQKYDSFVEYLLKNN